DTSSAPAASTAVVWVAAAALAARSADSISAKSDAAAVISSGAAITNDISHLQASQENPAVGRPSVTYGSYAESTEVVGEIHPESCAEFRQYGGSQGGCGTRCRNHGRPVWRLENPRVGVPEFTVRSTFPIGSRALRVIG